jgi:protoporphyrinogen oxidase
MHLAAELTLSLEDGPQEFDQVLVTTSPGLLARLAPGLPSDYLHGLLNLHSMGAVVMVLALSHPLSPQGYYWYNLPKQAGFPFLALVEHTNFLSPEYFGGQHLIYVGDYLDPDHENFRLSKEQLLDKFLPALAGLIRPSSRIGCRGRGCSAQHTPSRSRKSTTRQYS